MKSLRALIYAKFSSFGGFLFGYELAVLSSTISLIKADFELDQKLMGLLVSCILIGAIIGSIIGGNLSAKIGRKLTMTLGGSLVGLGGLLTFLLPKKFDIFLSTRIIEGIGIGLIFVAVPVYVSEIAPAKVRGAFGSLLHLFVGVGLTCGFYLCYNIPYLSDTYFDVPYGWKWLYLGQLPMALLYLAFICCISESPRWLLLKNRGNEALEVLHKISSSRDEEKILKQVSDVIEMEKVEAENSSGLGFAVKLKNTVAIVIALPFFSQITGISIVLYYATSVFQKVASQTMRLSQYEMVIVGLAFMSGTIAAMVFIDLIGRKPLLLIGPLLMALAMFQVGVSLVVKEVSYVSVYMVILYIAAHSFSLGVVTTVYISEILPEGLRGYGMGIAGMFNWFSSMFAEFLFPMMEKEHPLLEKLNGAIPFLFFGSVSIVFFIFALSIHETKRKTLEEIEEEWYKLDRKKIKHKTYL